MRPALWLIFAPLLIAQNAVYKISGTVVESATNHPLPRILVQIASTQARNATQSVITGADGAFSFANIPPGKYSLSAGRSNSGMQLYQGEEGFSTAIVVGPDLNSEGIIFPLQKSASISGTVLDEEGTGLRGAQVHLYWQHLVSGRLELTGPGTQVTKSSGQFRFGHLQEGTYYLAVQAHPWYAQNGGPAMMNSTNAAQNSGEAQQFDVAYPLTYYADATDPASATPITLASGGTASVQMTLRPVPAIHVRLPDMQTKPGMGSMVMVSALGPGGQKIMTGHHPIFIDGHQELTGLAPGRYEISMQTFQNGQQHLVGTKTTDLQNGSAIDFNGASSLSISGHITFEGKPRPPDPLMLLFTRPGSVFAQAPIAADGTFQAGIGNFSPGRYHLVLPNREGFVIQSATVKGGKWKDGQLELTEGANVQISLLATANATKLDGIALRDDKPAPGAMVLLLPTDPDRSDLIRRDQSDSDGTFTLPNVLPGRYRLLAIDNGHGLAYAEPAVLKPYLAAAQIITVDAGKSSPVKVNVQTRLP